MIVLRRLGGELIALNPDLIERVEATPDTVVTLVDEKKFLIEEDLDAVLQLITDYRAYIIARSRDISVADFDLSGRPTLHLVPTELVASPDTTYGISDAEAEVLGAVHPIDGTDGAADGRADGAAGGRADGAAGGRADGAAGGRGDEAGDGRGGRFA